MMSGSFKEYNWEDIKRLIFADMGLKTENEIRQRGEMRYIGGFQPPLAEDVTCIRIQCYHKPFDERIKEHADA